ncbi:phage holin [Paenibacillus polymyxa]|uniref:phage holin n=1 Tax=Paenibacillus polymyxa TaxID=1406 RepID=UPI0025B6BF63|nr:phage holin [Paenibacillus polymyxa]MDN4085985.1 phage holin [Paenibacillus polymyxa]MDN4111887.1 phage holin [Paenibacillus polymyxa]
MQTIIETVQPYVSTIATAILGVLTAIVIAGLNTIKVKANTWIDARTTESQRVLLHKLAEEGFSLAKTAYKEADGPKKLQEALSYVTGQLEQKGITLTPVEVQAAIEKAYLDYKAKQKSITPQTSIVTVEPKISLEEASQAAAKEAVSGLAAKLNDFLAQATAEVSPVAKVQPEPETIVPVQTPETTE